MTSTLYHAMTNTHRWTVAVATAVLLGCGTSADSKSGTTTQPPPPPPPPPDLPSLTLTASSPSDTIGAVIADPILVRVRRGTTAVSAADVRVSVVTPTGATPVATVGAAAAGPFGATLAAQTGADGDLQVFVSLGSAVGKGTILIDLPALSLHDSAHVTARAGHPAKSSVTPLDTTVFVGTTLRVNSQLFDRAGNPIVGETPVVVSANGVSATSTTGVFAAGPDAVRGQIILRTSVRTDTVQVSVVPRDTVVFDWFKDGRERIASVGLDGTIARIFGETTLLATGVYQPALSADGMRVVLEEGKGWGGSITAAKLYVADTTPTARHDIGGSVTIPRLRYHPLFSRTGDWIFFSSSTPEDSSSVWRVRSDGSGVVEPLIARGPTEFIFDAFPFPDDRTVAIVKNVPGSSAQMYRLDIVTKQLTPITTVGAPSLITIAVSPAADRIAWIELSGDVFVVNADGTGKRRVTTGINGLLERPVWTRDGRYLVAVPASGDVHSCIIDTVTGTVIPLPWNRFTGTVRFTQVGGRP